MTVTQEEIEAIRKRAEEIGEWHHEDEVDKLARIDVPELLAEIGRLKRTVIIFETALKEVEYYNEYYSGNIADKALSEAFRNE